MISPQSPARSISLAIRKAPSSRQRPFPRPMCPHLSLRRGPGRTRVRAPPGQTRIRAPPGLWHPGRGSLGQSWIAPGCQSSPGLPPGCPGSVRVSPGWSFRGTPGWSQSAPAPAPGPQGPQGPPGHSPAPPPPGSTTVKNKNRLCSKGLRRDLTIFW